MTYAITNPPRCISQSVGANGGDLWVYKDGDSLDDVAGVNYISNAAALGIKAGDAVLHIDETDLVTNLLTAVAHRTSGTAVGALCSAVEPIGESSIELQSAGTGSVLIDDIVTFDNDPDTEYRITTGDTDVSNGGTLVIAPNLVVATVIGTGISIKSGVINFATGKTGRKVHADASNAITARLLQPSESGDMFLFDDTDGRTYTLPPAVIGLKYSFMTTVLVTGGDTYGVLCSTTSTGDFFVGAVVGAIDAAATDETHFANGTSHLGIVSNATTKGGGIGGWLEIECLRANLWSIKGVWSVTATPATPFTT